MGLYTDSIKKREENNRKLEKYADEALIRNRKILRVEEDIDDFQTALIYLLECFGLSVSRIPGQQSVQTLMATLLDPLGMMYEERSSVVEAGRSRAEYLLAFRNDGKAVVLKPSARGYRYFCPFDSGEGRASKGYIASLQPVCYSAVMTENPLVHSIRDLCAGASVLCSSSAEYSRVRSRIM